MLYIQTWYLIFYKIIVINFDTHLDTQWRFGAISSTHSGLMAFQVHKVISTEKCGKAYEIAFSFSWNIMIKT